MLLGRGFLLSVMSVGLAAGHLMATAAISCCMSALAVESMGNVPIGTKDCVYRVNFQLI